MKQYQKPIVLLNSDLAEGVYTASGGITTDNYIINPQGSDGTSQYYYITIKNTSGETVDSVSVTVSTKGNVTGIYDEKGNISYTINGDGTATITYSSSDSKIIPNEPIENIYIRVSGTGDFGIS